MVDDVGGFVEGEMSIPSTAKSGGKLGEPDFNTLDEPIRETIVCFSFYHYRSIYSSCCF